MQKKKLYTFHADVDLMIPFIVFSRLFFIERSFINRVDSSEDI